MIYLSDANLTGIQGILQGMFKKVWETVPALDLGRDFMAVVLNSRVDKNTQLQIFLRNVYMGNYKGQQIYGFDVAAQMYYHKKVAEMSQDEIIALVAMIKAPNKYHPLDSKQFHTQRVRRIQRLLRKECKPNGVFDADLNGCAG